MFVPSFSQSQIPDTSWGRSSSDDKEAPSLVGSRETLPVRNILIVVGVVSMIAIGVLVAVGFAVIGWPVWLPVVIGVAGAVFIGCVALAIFRAYNAEPARKREALRLQAACDVLTRLNNISSIQAFESNMLGQPFPYMAAKSIETKSIARGQCKKVYELNKDLVWMKPKRGQEHVLLDELESVQRIEKAVETIFQEKGCQGDVPETSSCLALSARLVILDGNHAPRAVASRYFGDLDKLFSEKNPNLPSTQDILHIICDICVGMSYLHEAGYTHGDMQMGNVLVKQVGGEWRAAITDFGQTTTLDAGGDAGILHGHWSYSSPEQRRHRPSDVYGLGLLAAWLLERGVLNRPQEETIASEFPVTVGDRGLVAFAKTGVRRAAGALGNLTSARSTFIAYHPEERIHAHLDALINPLNGALREAGFNENATDLIGLLKEMTRDNPWAEGPGRRITMPEVMEKLGEMGFNPQPELWDKDPVLLGQEKEEVIEVPEHLGQEKEGVIEVLERVGQEIGG